MAIRQLTKQEIFDRVADHLAKQGAPAVGEIITDAGGEPACQYRAPNGRRCAIGALIPDELYEVRLEGSWASQLGERSSELFFYDKCGLGGVRGYFLDCLQNVHDEAAEDYSDRNPNVPNIETRDLWAIGLAERAKQFELIFDREAWERKYNHTLAVGPSA